LESSFGGPAWTLDLSTGEFYLHLCSRRQPDLNWENPKVRHRIYEMMNWWLDRGIAGFRMDVTDYIGKQVDQEVIKDGPHLHDYLQEMSANTFGGRDALTVGEPGGATSGSALLYPGGTATSCPWFFNSSMSPSNGTTFMASGVRNRSTS
jgi:oligo-1,6-glucosidase